MADPSTEGSRPPLLVHLDTDLGGDPDDIAALVMLLGWPGVEITGITTNLDPEGRRAGCVHEVLRLAGRTDIPVAAGSASTLTTGARLAPSDRDPRFWPDGVTPAPSPPGAALDLLASSIERGAVVAAVGAYTNLALLEIVRPGHLVAAGVVAMGGWLMAPAEGLPPWGPERDFNVQSDTLAAAILTEAGADLVFVPIPAAAPAHLRARDLPRLEAAGPLGRLIAAQATAWGRDHRFPALAAAHPALADDLVLFHWDPVTCAVAAGWEGVAGEDVRLVTELDDGVLHFVPDPLGRRCRVVTSVDADDFVERWITCVEAVAAVSP